MVTEKSDCLLPHTNNSVLDETSVVHSTVEALNDNVTVESKNVCYTNIVQFIYNIKISFWMILFFKKNFITIIMILLSKFITNNRYTCVYF